MPIFSFIHSGLYRFFLKVVSFKKDTKVKDKVAIVTGAEKSIGKETAIELARRGAKVYITSSDSTKGEEALKKIKEKSGSSSVHFLLLDLASMDSIRDFSKKFHELETKLDILVNNANVIACPQTTTKDGFEMQIGTNHLGHFLLTNLLLDVLKAASPSRIVVVSSMFHKWGTINKEDLNNGSSYCKYRAYCQSKLANNLFTHELSKKLEGTGVTVNCLHPGFVVKELLDRIPFSESIKGYLDPIARQFLNTSKEGAQTSIFLSVDPDVEKTSGKYFKDCKEAEPSPDSRNDELGSWLWKKSEELLGLNYV